ncbi:amidohydrolase family protein [Paenibacillus eucommiae]|uniref:TIM-barrel fold metal-dependent hydrolase n=1 Tax=Paenibacillus eucommiae TaxID=1355755 RepID=A0ABS4IRE6_9BACL|nr:amidohydrolase family protein [Paenibacillus eucommiae]MBP1990141.1 putative TIM-barrel fold metal-dependent hydrolase [Paenibacillus eucommiae]
MLLKEYAEQGIPLKDVSVIDVHSHIGPYAGNYVPYSHDEEAQMLQFTKNLDRVGVDYAIVSMLRGLHTHELEANLDLAKMMETNRKILGWITYIPSLQQKSLEMAEQCFSISNRFVGIKIHPEFNMHPIDGAGYEPMWEYADAKGLLVLVHIWGRCPYSDPERLRGIAKKYRNLTVLIGHSGGEEPGTTTAIELSNTYDNMFLDLTGAFICSKRTLEHFVRRADSDKLLFSSDAVFNNLTYDLGEILYARVSEEIKAKVLGLNAQRLLKDFI